MEKRKLSKRIKYSLLVKFVKGVIFLAGVFPRKWVVYFYGFLANIAYLFLKDTRKLVQKNLTIAFKEEKTPKELQEIGKKMFHNLGKNAADILHSMNFTKLEELEKFVKVEGLEHLENALEKGDGVIALTCHMGSFELLPTFFGLKKYPTYIVGTAMKDPRLDKLLVENRTQRGVRNAHRGKDTIKLVRALKNGEMLAILIDQDTKVKSVFADFFGKPASTPVGATIFAMKTGARVIPMAIRRMPDETQLITILPEVPITKTGDMEKDLQVNTQKFNDKLEQLIRQDVTQWVWMHERWKTRPENE